MAYTLYYPPGYAQAGITNQLWCSFLLKLGLPTHSTPFAVLPAAAFAIRCVVYNKLPTWKAPGQKSHRVPLSTDHIHKALLSQGSETSPDRAGL